jgi:hypothetical protein
MTASNSTTTKEQAVALEPATTEGPKRRARRIVTVAVASVVAFMTLATMASPANAWVYGASLGRPGWVAPPQVSVADIDVQTSSGPVTTLTYMTDTGPAVGRSPASSGAQDVLGRYALEKWSGGQWSMVAYGTVRSRIPSGGTSVTLQRLYMQPQNVGVGYFRISIYVVWAVAGSGQALGGTSAFSDRTSDHRCITRRCEVGAGYVKIRGIYGW